MVFKRQKEKEGFTPPLRPRAGFTLAETMVVVFIMVILGSLLLANARQPSRKFELERGAQIVASDIRRVQTLATTAQVTSCPSGDIVPYFGIRIRVNPNEPANFELFADCNKNLNWDGSDQSIDTLFLDNIVVESTSDGNIMTVVFIPPNPDLAINGTINPNSERTTICHINDLSLCRDIWITRKGVVGVN